MASRYKQTESEHIRKQGFVQGLRTAHSILRKARNRQARKERNTNEQSDPDVKALYEHGANLLHAICLKVQGEIQRARGK